MPNFSFNPAGAIKPRQPVNSDVGGVFRGEVVVNHSKAVQRYLAPSRPVQLSNRLKRRKYGLRKIKVVINDEN